MSFVDQIDEIQKRLTEHAIDGWLLFDFHGSNRFAHGLLRIPPESVLTRRFFYWIPKEGNPVKIVHRIEMESLAYLPGSSELYLSWNEFEEAISKVLKNVKKVAMEYSPRNSNPYVSVVDAGIVELVGGCGVEVVSSADLLQHFTSILSEKQIASHRDAAQVVSDTVENAWEMIAGRIRADKNVTEYDVQKFILSEFTAKNCITEDGPTCAVDAHSALPHYMATKKMAQPIGRGDFLLIDLWCKQNLPYGVYADITRVAVAAPEPTPRQQEIFDIVHEAREAGIELVRSRFAAGEVVRGYEVDDVCRQVIEKAGYASHFTHRTGHNIDTSVHGAGAHLDNLETSDQRKILPGTVFSIEPGIYLEGDFGVRLESNVIVAHDGSVEISGGKQDSIRCLL